MTFEEFKKLITETRGIGIDRMWRKMVEAGVDDPEGA